jgi:hypothetical protein
MGTGGKKQFKREADLLPLSGVMAKNAPFPYTSLWPYA